MFFRSNFRSYRSLIDHRFGKTAGPEMSDSVFFLRDVRKVREKGGCRFDLNVPTMAVDRGEFVAVLGPSGCGKSTLLDLLAFVLKPTSFKTFRFSARELRGALVDLRTVSASALARIRKSSIGYVLQSGGLLPFLSVEENILLPSRLNGLTDGTGRMLALARILGIEDQLAKKPMHLSGGQRQRVAIARAIAHWPSVVLADEPTAAVDELTAGEIMAVFGRLAKKMGITVILVTHSKALATHSADRLFSFRIIRQSRERTSSTLCEGDCA